MSLFSNAVGRKVLMGVTGLLMVLFILGHLLGNSSIFAGSEALNSYAEHLHNLAPLVWLTRIVMVTMLVVHIFFGLILTMENSDANPTKYQVSRKLKATFSSETMIWTGLLMLVFILFHLLQFTLRVTPDILPEAVAKKPGDVFAMVSHSFRITPIAGVYVAAMVVLFLHLSHGIQSIFQSLGLNNDKTLPKFTTLGKVLATIFLLGYCAIPVSILTGILSK